MKHETRVIVLCSAGHFFTHMNMLVFPVIVSPFAPDMGLSLAQTFPIGFMMYFLYGALALPAGLLADKWSKVGALQLCLGGIGISSILAGLSGSVIGFTISIALMGIFCGLYHPAGLGLIAQEIKEQGKAHGANGVFGALGIASAPLVAGLILFFLSWRWVYIIVGAIALVAFVGSLLFKVTQRDKVTEKSAQTEGAQIRNAYGAFAVLCVSMTIAGFIYRANMTALPVYFELKLGDILAMIETAVPASANAISGSSALLVGFVFLFSMAGQIGGGRLADNIDLRKAFLLYQIISLPLVFGMAMFSGAWLIIFAAGYAFFSLGIQPIENSLVPKFMPPGLASTGYGIKFTLTFGLGSLAVYQVAYMEEFWGLDKLYMMLAGQTVALIASTLTLIYVTRNILAVINRNPGTKRIDD